MRTLRVALALVGCVLWIACGPTSTDQPRLDPDAGTPQAAGATESGCGPTTCAGCCQFDACIPSMACGGRSCAECAACNGSNCKGCCRGPVCDEGTSASACGHAGDQCRACADTQVCEAGACLQDLGQECDREKRLFCAHHAVCVQQEGLQGRTCQLEHAP